MLVEHTTELQPPVSLDIGCCLFACLWIFLLVCLYFFLDRVSLCCPSWPRALYKSGWPQSHGNPPASASPVLRLSFLYFRFFFWVFKIENRFFFHTDQSLLSATPLSRPPPSPIKKIRSSETTVKHYKTKYNRTRQKTLTPQLSKETQQRESSKSILKSQRHNSVRSPTKHTKYIKTPEDLVQTPAGPVSPNVPCLVENPALWAGEWEGWSA